MQKILNVRQIGYLHHMDADPRCPESFALPACMTSLMEYMHGDTDSITIQAHGRTWQKRTLNDAILAHTGMAFGLLWHEDHCPSSLDLTQVNPHDDTIKYAFDYVGYDHQVVYRTDDNRDAMRQLIVESIDAGVPVLAFGIVGPPECAIVCGYQHGGDTLVGWSHFQSHDPADCIDNGMFKAQDWHKHIWKIVLCKNKKPRSDALAPMIRRGISIMEATELAGYHAGTAAYDAWLRYINQSEYDTATDEHLKNIYWLHSVLVGNHAEARCYLGGYLERLPGGDTHIRQAAQCFSDIHDTCWKTWDVGGGLYAADAYQCLRDVSKREQICALLQQIRRLDEQALHSLKAWVAARD